MMKLVMGLPPSSVGGVQVRVRVVGVMSEALGAPGAVGTSGENKREKQFCIYTAFDRL